MIRTFGMAALLAAVAVPAAASAQGVLTQTIAGTRLDIAATGEVTRVPDVAIINTGVVTRAPSAREAISQNAAQMQRVVARLRRAGVAERDIQTSAVSLNPDYRYQDNQPPVLTGYQATNQVTVRFRKIEDSGAILDALVAEGANQINGPTLTIDKPEAAQDEARLAALTQARARAETYARAIGKRVTRIVAISETGAAAPVMYEGPRLVAQSRAADTKIVPGEQAVSVSLNVTFELD
jgi:uncharacterized protein